MANSILVSVQDGLEEPAWLSKVEPFVILAMKKLGFDGEEFSIMFTDDKMMRELNNSYRQIDSSTDVLSFENGEEYTDEDGNKWICAGDIAISLDMLPKNAEYFECSENDELKQDV